jgi:hypothetical protein
MPSFTARLKVQMEACIRIMRGLIKESLSGESRSLRFLAVGFRTSNNNQTTETTHFKSRPLGSLKHHDVLCWCSR